MKISTLEMTGFKKYIEQTEIKFGDITVISGENGSGKSSVAEAISYVLFGTDTFGGKLNPVNLEEPQDVNVKINVVDDSGMEFSLGRAIENGKPKLYLNEAPTKATEFKEVVDAYFSKEHFLTLFNPTYFATQHWTAQRQQFMSHLKEPLIEQVLSKAGPVAKKTLEAPLKKLDIDKLELKHKDLKKKSDTELVKLQERGETYKRTSKAGNGLDVKQAKADLDEIEDRIKQNQELQKEYRKAEKQREALQSKFDNAVTELERKANEVREMQAEDLLAVCVTCGQDLTTEQQEKIEKEKAEKIEKGKESGRAWVAVRNEAKAELAAFVMPAIVPDVIELQEHRMKLREDIAAAKSVDYTAEIEETKVAYKKTRDENVASADILDNIKVFRNAKTELMAEQANELFERLSLKLFKDLANGSTEATFEIEYDGKPYSTLSTAERILAGIELRNAFLKMTAERELETAPIFIDNSESISSDVYELTTGQVMLAEVQRAEFAVNEWERVEA